jgi:hypothetical protein
MSIPILMALIDGALCAAEAVVVCYARSETLPAGLLLAFALISFGLIIGVLIRFPPTRSNAPSARARDHHVVLLLPACPERSPD